MPFPFLTILQFLSLFFSFQQISCGNNATDLEALLAFKAAIVSDPHNALSSWNAAVDFCTWNGVTCSHSHRDRVVSINLRYQDLAGSLSPFIGNLSFLRSIFLRNNWFSGQIPGEIGRLRRLEYINLSNNSFSGEIPRNITHCRDLNSLVLIHNNLTGRIIPEIGSLLKLQGLGLESNRFSGTIPPWIGNLTSLSHLSMYHCGLEGQIPESLVHLHNLRYIELGENRLTGSIPSQLFNSSIEVLSLEANQLQGTIPSDAGHTLRNIHRLNLGANKLSGEIPVSLLNASSLEFIMLVENKFNGPMLRNFESLPNLFYLNVADNSVHGDVSFISSLTNCTRLKALIVGGNLLNGSLPDSIANLSRMLVMLSLDNNNIHGTLPSGIKNLLDLTFMILGNNYLSGPIPLSIGELGSLQVLILEGNRFTGDIPPSLGNLTLLTDLYMGNNHLSGCIPPTLGNNSNLLTFSLSHNNLNGTMPREIFSLSFISISFILAYNELTGVIPPEVGHLRNLGYLDLSNNRLSGSIPNVMSSCMSLELLHLEGNLFEGEIPRALGDLRGLQDLDLSRNRLSGSIPNSLCELRLLINLNLSSNELEGKVPTSGVFLNTSAIFLDGNVDLCGGVADLRLQPCSRMNSKHRKLPNKVLKIAVPLGVLGVICSILLVLFCALMYRRKSKGQSLTSVPSMEGQFARLSYADLLKATSGFSRNNLIGVGRFGSVYKGSLDDGMAMVAVKVLDLDVRGATKTFMAECNALRWMRHRNLVKIISVCLSLDFQGQDFKALVYEYKSNGSLEEWLHHNPVEQREEDRGLTMIQRLNIAIDIACALEYLHFGTDSVVIHGDLKPSNILLDDNMTACVGDFGLAKVVLSISKELLTKESNSSVIKGTIGYIAPEYGMGGMVSTQGDVYSFGILLLEMFTKIRPTDGAFNDHSNLSSFVSSALPDSMMDILDPVIVQEIRVSDDYKAKETMLYVLEIGLACSNKSPRDRLAMTNVVAELRQIMSGYLAERMS
ncbi:probable LRR receptor-like serine/threonine-protein kinase At3g47570 [Andrographis paniculata]|uniref:probable LRR receptor-like serine/threonine-protein kinase At3g47570 n=1 Tax=Andrographis paniculata TaxID=175694 RepID=UPI0021E6F608|nr:probable LRR receptor-like serine/threonine-protein kinase At3g47570 [Andrographis paniculata]